eukprot:2938953-Amphidinium_carterae.1
MSTSVVASCQASSSGSERKPGICNISVVALLRLSTECSQSSPARICLRLTRVGYVNAGWR